jgi:hypothetical protein
MLKVKRHSLSLALQAELDNRQAVVNAGDSSWKAFRKDGPYKDLMDVLQAMFHGKCAYCESGGASHPDHYWPKSPHPQNAHKGTLAKMFAWDNLLLSCETCNGFECKASRMEWYDGDKPKPELKSKLDVWVLPPQDCKGGTIK